MARAFKRVKNTQLCMSMFINEITHTHSYMYNHVCMYVSYARHMHMPISFAWACMGFIARQCLVILVKYIKSRALWYLYPG